MRPKFIYSAPILLTMLLAAAPVMLDRSLVAAQQADTTQAEADRLFQQGVQQYRRGQYLQALPTYQKVLAIRQAQNNKAGIAQVLNSLGELYSTLNETDKALNALQQALIIRRELKDRSGEGETLDNIGFVYYWQDQYDKALATLQQALTIRREVNDRLGEAKTLSKIAGVYSDGSKRHAEALALLKQAIAIQSDDKFQAGRTLTRTARVYWNQGNTAQALETVKKALATSQEIGDRALEGRALSFMGVLYSEQNQYDLARQQYQRSVPILEQAGLYRDAYNALSVLAYSYFSENAIDQSLKAHQQASAFAQQHQLRPETLKSFGALLDIYTVKISSFTAQGLDAQAKIESSRLIDLVQQILPLARELKKPDEEAKASAALGYAYLILGDIQKAEAVSQQAATQARAAKALDVEANALSTLGTIYLNRGNFRKNVEVLLRTVEIRRAQNDKRSESITLASLASNYNGLGEYQNAIAAYQQSLALIPQVDLSKLAPVLRQSFQEFESWTLQGLTFPYTRLGEYDKALQFAELALSKAQALNAPRLEVGARLRLAFLYRNHFRNYAKATELIQQALTTAKQIPDPQREAEALTELGEVYAAQQNYAQALDRANQSRSIAQRIGNLNLERASVDLLWKIYYEQGKYTESLPIAQDLLLLVQKAKTRQFEHFALTNLSDNHLALGDTAKAETIAKQALALAQEQKIPANVASAYAQLVKTYNARGEYEQAIQAGQNIQVVARQLNDTLLEVIASVSLSDTYRTLGEYQKVIALAQPALIQAQKTKRRDYEAELLLNLGDAYRLTGDYTKAKATIEQGQKIAIELQQPRLQAIALNNLGYFYTSINDYPNALKATQQSLKIAQDLKSPPLLISPYFNLGDIYDNLGEYNKSKDYYQQASATAKQLKNRRSEGVAAFVLAYTAFKQGEPQKTVELANQSSAIFREIKQPALDAFAMRALSVGYGGLGNDAKAIEAAQTFLSFARKTQNTVWEKDALSLIGALHRKFGRKEQAIASYEQALAIKSDAQVTGADAFVYAGLARARRDLKQSIVAITHYKQAIEQLQAIRRNITGLSPELQISFLQATVDLDRTKTADIYRELASLLLDQGQLSEAQKVLELLKEQELKNITQPTQTNSQKITLQDAQERIRQQHGTLIALGQKLDECQKTSANPAQQCSDLNKQRQIITDRYNKDVQQIQDQLGDRPIKDKDFLDPGDPFNRKASELIEQQPDAVLIYPLVVENRVKLLMASKGGILQQFQVSVSQTELNQTVDRFQVLLRDPASDLKEVQATGQKLYSWLIQPLEKELKAGQVKHLVFALDRATRYIPMAALFDGKQYLIENYTVASVLSADKTDFTTGRLPSDRSTLKVLAMGLSNPVPGWSPLPNVPQELDTIVRQSRTDSGIFPGQKFLNQSFTFDALRDNLYGHQILHLATHGKFVAGNPAESFILLGNGDKLTIPQIGTLQDLLKVNLVTLSACETALGETRRDGLEIAGVSNFILAKSKSVMASLWQVNDRSTEELMEQFYRQLASNQPTKAEALRQAQLALLHNHAGSKSTPTKRGEEWVQPIRPNQPTRGTAIMSGTAHPYHWAAFILIGNSL